MNATSPLGGLVAEKTPWGVRDIYNDLYDQINIAYLRNDIDPLPFRRDYAPHFMRYNAQSVLGRIAQAAGFYKAGADALPTDLAGITESFRPGKRWFGHALPRMGEQTVYDVVEGFDQYIETAADAITLTDSIQALRELEDGVRYRLSDQETRDRVDAIRNDQSLTPLERRKDIEAVYEESRMGMRNLVTEMRRYKVNAARTP